MLEDRMLNAAPPHSSAPARRTAVALALAAPLALLSARCVAPPRPSPGELSPAASSSEPEGGLAAPSVSAAASSASAVGLPSARPSASVAAPLASCGSAMATYGAETFRVLEEDDPERWIRGLHPPPPEQVSVVPFCLDKTEVTVAAYAACVAASRCDPVEPDEVGLPPCNRDVATRKNHPVNCVTQAQAHAYCAFAGKRLPSGVELAFAAQGGAKNRRHPWGKAPFDSTRGNACGLECSEGRGDLPGRDAYPTTAPVGSFPRGANPEGVQDLVGNVKEWTSITIPDDGIRGGGQTFGTSWDDRSASLLSQPSTVLGISHSTAELATLGFRCAASR